MQKSPSTFDSTVFDFPEHFTADTCIVLTSIAVTRLHAIRTLSHKELEQKLIDISKKERVKIVQLMPSEHRKTKPKPHFPIQLDLFVFTVKQTVDALLR
jgi:hypothetical protein